METSVLDVDNLANDLDKWKGLVPELELVPDEEEAERASQFSLVGKLVSNKTFKSGVVKLVLQRAWWHLKGFSVDSIAGNTFLFTFHSQQDRNRIWDRRPWTINGAHLVLKKWDPNLALEDIDFTFSSFWVQVHGLPLKYLNRTNVEKIGNLIGSVNKVQEEVKQNLAGLRFLRFNVELDTTKPISSGFFHKQGSGGTWVHFRYERLADFCYQCGLLGHQTHHCSQASFGSNTSEAEKFSNLYGPWIKAEFSAYTNVSEGSNSRKVKLQNSDLVGVSSSKDLATAKFEQAASHPESCSSIEIQPTTPSSPSLQGLLQGLSSSVTSDVPRRALEESYVCVAQESNHSLLQRGTDRVFPNLPFSVRDISSSILNGPRRPSFSFNNPIFKPQATPQSCTQGSMSLICEGPSGIAVKKRKLDLLKEGEVHVGPREEKVPSLSGVNQQSLELTRIGRTAVDALPLLNVGTTPTLDSGLENACFSVGIREEGRKYVKGKNLKKLARSTVRVSMTLNSQVSSQEVVVVDEASSDVTLAEEAGLIMPPPQP